MALKFMRGWAQRLTPHEHAQVIVGLGLGLGLGEGYLTLTQPYSR